LLAAESLASESLALESLALESLASESRKGRFCNACGNESGMTGGYNEIKESKEARLERQSGW
jgi:hypothetical protein